MLATPDVSVERLRDKSLPAGDGCRYVALLTLNPLVRQLALPACAPLTTGSDRKVAVDVHDEVDDVTMPGLFVRNVVTSWIGGSVFPAAGELIAAPGALFPPLGCCSSFS